MSGYHYTATTSTSGSGPAWTRSEPFARCKFVESMRTCALPAAYPRSRNFMPRSHMLWSLVTHIGQNRAECSLPTKSTYHVCRLLNMNFGGPAIHVLG
jgi:hypothetical protein